MESLRPCPFCGKISALDNYHDNTIRLRCATEGCPAARSIICKEVEAIAAWNRRFPAPEGSKPEGLAAALEEIISEAKAQMRGDGIPEHLIGTPGGFTSRIISVATAALASLHPKPDARVESLREDDFFMAGLDCWPDLEK